MIAPGDVISHNLMCHEEGVTLQRGMNFRLRGMRTVILMSLRRGAPYEDQVLENGRVLIYEGHNIPQTKDGPNPKRVDQQSSTSTGRPTQNGLFFDAAIRAKRGEAPPELVRVYEKIRDGIWVFNGIFELKDSWQELSGRRKVFKFKLLLTEANGSPDEATVRDLPHNRVIPSSVKLEVWKRDGGKCVLCGARENLHFDHDIPYSQGGSSLVAKNVQLLCARHNLEKHDKIQ